MKRNYAPTVTLYVYRWNRPPGASRKGQLCRVLVRSKAMNTCLIEFEDGFRMTTSRNAIKKYKGNGDEA